MTKSKNENGVENDPLTIPFEFPAYWTQDQALAIYELLDGLRVSILNHYQLQLDEPFDEPYPPCHVEPAANAKPDEKPPLDDELPF
jgi:hypothetical protein